MDWTDLAVSIHHWFVTPLAVTAGAFFFALLLAELVVRFTKLPRVAALSLAGVAIGILRNNFDFAHLMPLPSALLEALAMVLLFEVGQRVPLAWIRSNPWILLASVGESVLAFALISSVLVFGFSFSYLDASLVAVICMTSSPIVVMSVSKEFGARGQVSERALLFSTLSSVYAVLIVHFSVSGYLTTTNAHLDIALQPLLQLFGAFLMGTAAAAALRLFAAVTRAQSALLTIGILCGCMGIYAAAPSFGLSPILSALFFGLVLRSTDRSHRLLAYQTSETGVVISLAYFIILGASLAFPDSWDLAAVVAAVIVARLVAKLAGNAVCAIPAALSPLKGTMLGVALAPLSSLALVLADALGNQDALTHAAIVSTCVISVMAIIGPVLTEIALRWARESSRGRK